jgi:signal transduction histidine kinase/CheY-like chemotaxis protein
MAMSIRAAQLYKFLDWFIPPPLSHERDMRQRAHMFLLSHIFGPFLGNVITVYLYFLDPHPGFALVTLALSISAFWAFPLLLRLTGRYTLLSVLSVQNLTFAILWGCYHYGGVSSPFLPWLLTVPLLAFFYLGPAYRARLIVLGVVALNLVGFYVFYALNQEFPQHVPLSSLQGIGIVSSLCAAVYVSMMAVYYANILASQAGLEAEVRRHLATAAELRRATAEAERAGKAKSEFLARMSHELRTPLNAVIGYSQMLLEAAHDGNNQMAADLEKIHTAGQHLLNLITEVLDLSKIDAGRMELFHEPVEIGALLTECIESQCALVESRNNTLTVEFSDRLGVISCDVKKLKQAVTNIIENAAKFTHGGRIVVAAARTSHDAEERLVVSVRDSGLGIGGADMPKLFDVFTEATDSTPTKYGSAGLGLALSRKLTELMGGSISVESELGVGSCFTLTLPVTPQDGECNTVSPMGPTLAPVDHPQRGSVLIIDDDPESLELTERMLRKEGWETLVARNASEALDLARSALPSLILLDVLMPDMDGWELLRALKGDPSVAACPVVMLSVVDNLERGVALGAADHLTKPLDRERLMTVVSRLAAENAAASNLPQRFRNMLEDDVKSLLDPSTLETFSA